MLQEIRTDHPTTNRIVWIGLREEPVVYVNSEPYCLRREKFSLRNMKGMAEPWKIHSAYGHSQIMVASLVLGWKF